MNVDFEAISDCAKGGEGNLLHKLAGDKTHGLRPKVRQNIFASRVSKYFMMFTLVVRSARIFI